MKKCSLDSKVTSDNILIKHFNSFSLCLPPFFFLLPAAKTAQAILGKILWHKFLICSCFTKYSFSLLQFTSPQMSPPVVNRTCPGSTQTNSFCFTLPKIQFKSLSQLRDWHETSPKEAQALPVLSRLNQDKETVGCILHILQIALN